MAAYYPSGYAGTTGYYDYSTSASNSPAPDDAYVYAIPAYQTPQGKRHHARTASYQNPRMYPSPAHFPSPGYYATHYDYNSPPVARYDYVSTHKTSTRKSRRDDSPLRNKSKPKQRIYPDVTDDASDDDDDRVRPVYHTIRPRAGSGAFVRTTTTFQKKRPVSSNTNKAFVQTYDTSVETPVRSRARRASAADRHNLSTPKRSSKSAPKPVAPEATAADARKFNIPAGYSLKNWDPTEEPILLLGSAFDSNSLGKWIYDWTVYHHRAGAPITEVAGELWLLLIKFSGKMKRAEECLPRIRNHENKDMMGDFLRTGDKIWGKMKALLEMCEKFMWKTAQKEGEKVSMGEKSGVEFVRTIFGRERELERTERLMTSIRLWNMRFDANCEDILRRPSAN